MKKTIFSILFFAFCSYASAQWEQLNGPRIGEEDGMAFYNDTIYKGGYNNFFYSVNEGQNWIPICTSINDIIDFDYVIRLLIKHDNIFLASIYGKSIYKSIDYGQTWNVSNTGLDAYNESVTALVDFDDIVLAGSYGGLHYSLDYGDTWHLADGYTEYDAIVGFTKYQDSILAMTDRGEVYVSKFGLSWNLKYNFDCYDQYCDIVSNSTNIFAIGDTSKLFTSIDMGESWSELQLPQNNFVLTSIACRDNEIAVGTMKDGILYSSDNGVTWDYLNAGLTKFYNRVYFMDDVLFSVSRGGTHVYENNLWVSRNDNQQIGSCYQLVVVGDTILAVYDAWDLHFSDSGGENWESINNNITFGTGDHGEVYDILKIENNLFRVAEYSGVLYSSDNGENWIHRNNGLECSTIKQIEYNGECLYIITDTCGMFRSCDFGLNWFPCCPEIPNDGVQSNTFELTETNGILSLYFGQEYYTTNGGLTWTEINPPLFFSDASIKDSVILVGGQYGNTQISTDNFLTWQTYNDGIPPMDPQWPNLDVWQVATDGTNFFLGSQHHGMYALINNVWSPINYGLDFSTLNCSTNEICISNGFLYFSMLYHGLWKRSINKIMQRSLSGIVYSDVNANGVKDDGEFGVTNAILNTVNANGFYTSDSIGFYNAYSDFPNDTIKVYASSNYYTSSPEYYTFSSSTENLDFGVFFNPNIKDLRVTNTSYVAPSPGFIYNLIVTYLNDGTETMSGSVKLEFDSEIDFISSVPIADAITDSTIEWAFNDLNVMQSENILLEFYIPPTIGLANNLEFTSTVYPIENDTTPNNNTDFLSEVIVASFDPNDKSVRPEGNILPSFVEEQEELQFTIRFQNTGTDTAFNIVIVDSLSNNLFIPSFRVLSSSHNYEYSISGPGIVEFSFPNVMLPDSNINEALSHGFIKYSIKPLPSLVIGDEIRNTAYIYFDFNEAVLTNTTSNTVSVIQNISSSVTGYIYSLYPNPVTDRLSFATNCSEPMKIKVCDIQGRIVYSKNEELDNFEIDCSFLTSGFYFLIVSTKTETVNFKIVKD